jgi:hypothetical protein
MKTSQLLPRRRRARMEKKKKDSSPNPQEWSRNIPNNQKRVPALTHQA